MRCTSSFYDTFVFRWLCTRPEYSRPRHMLGGTAVAPAALNRICVPQSSWVAIPHEYASSGVAFDTMRLTIDRDSRASMLVPVEHAATDVPHSISLHYFSITVLCLTIDSLALRRRNWINGQISVNSP